MIEKRVADKYSHALLSVAETYGTEDVFLKQLEGIVSLQNTTPSIKIFLISPTIPKTVKKNVIKTICEGKYEPKLVRFFLLLIDKLRFQYLPEIVECYKKKLLGKRGVVQVKMITAIPATSEESQAFKARIEALTGKKIELLESLDPKIGGGGVLILDQHIYDASVSTKLERLKNHLLS